MDRELATLASVEGMLIRGGTSKGLFLREAELPSPGDTRDELVLELFGTPDPLQLDGVGGTHSHTSKVMIVSESDNSGVDVEYTFGQVGVTEPVVDYSGNCGNLTSAVGVFAVLSGIVSPDGPTATLTLYNRNTDSLVTQDLPIESGEPAWRGTYSIDGVPGTGARIDSHFESPGGEIYGGSILPTGESVDTIRVDGDDVRVSVVDAVNLCVFLLASDIGLTGTELPADLESDGQVLPTLERIRGTVCERLGFVDDAGDAASEQPSTPLVGVLSEPQSYDTSVGTRVEADDIDITSRMISSQSPHHAIPATGAISLAAATRVPGTVPNDLVRARPEADVVTIGHPKGTISLGVSTAPDDAGETSADRAVERITVGRTARAIMGGKVYHRGTVQD